MDLERYLMLYEYDKSMPLNPEVSKVSETNNYTLFKVYYDSVNSQRVPAVFTVPKVNNLPYPCIVFLHGYGGKKEDMLPVADVFSKRGYSTFSIDAPLHGERRVPGKVLFSPELEEFKANIIQTIVDLRRAIDFLETRPEVSKNNIGYAGGSMGGILGALFVSIEPRIKAAAIVVGGGNLSLLIKESRHPSILPIRAKLKKCGINYEQLSKILAPVDPISFIHLVAPRPIQFHCGKYDDIVPAETQRQLAERAGEPKEVYWYEAGHGLPLNLVLERILAFFDKHLKTSKT